MAQERDRDDLQALGAGRLDLSRFRSGLLRAILAIRETGSGNDTQRRVQAGCGLHCDDQRPDRCPAIYTQDR